MNDPLFKSMTKNMAGKLAINLGKNMKQETYFHTCALFTIMSHAMLTC